MQGRMTRRTALQMAAVSAAAVIPVPRALAATLPSGRLSDARARAIEQAADALSKSAFPIPIASPADVASRVADAYSALPPERQRGWDAMVDQVIKAAPSFSSASRADRVTVLRRGATGTSDRLPFAQPLIFLIASVLIPNDHRLAGGGFEV
jgi:hypothetical protein